MTVILNNTSWLSNVFSSDWIVAAGVVVVYDWMLTLGQEIELIWKQHWSLMTVLYLVTRYMGIPYFVLFMLENIPFVSLTDAVSNIMSYAKNVTNVVITAVLDVIMISRLHAMYQRSCMMLIFLVIIFLAVNIPCGVITAIVLKDTVAEEVIFSDTYMCNDRFEGDDQLLVAMVWMLNTIWEVLALCLSVWIAVKHFRKLRQLGPLTGSTIGDCFRVLIKSHVLYFASFVCVSCLQLADFFPELKNSNSIGAQTLIGSLQILWRVQMFVLGPRLILSIREYYAKLVADSNAETSMASIVFQERVTTSSTV